MSEAEKEAREEAERRWPTPDPHTGADLQPVDAARRQGFVAGSEWQASRAPQPTDEGQREPVAVVQAALDAERLRKIAEWMSGEGLKQTAAWLTRIAIRHERLAAGFRRAPAEHDVEYVREGVCLLCGAGVLSSGEHLDPERHAEWVAKVTSGAPAEPAVQGEWEYGIRSEYDEIPLSELWPTFDLAQARVSNIRGGRWVIIRRRKAGPWEPVPRGADDEQ